MAKLYFYYSAMNAGKTTTLLQSSHNYAERGMSTMVLKPQVDNREEQSRIRSRIGLEAEAIIFSPAEDLFRLVQSQLAKTALACILVDLSLIHI